MQGGFLAEWVGAPAAIEMGTIVMVFLGAMFLAMTARRPMPEIEHV
jgi:hypothetical protein